MLVVAVVVQLVSVDVLVSWAAVHHALPRCAHYGSAHCSDRGADRSADHSTDNSPSDCAGCRGPTCGGVLFANVRALVVMLSLE
jgi:hypothetical protein